MGEILSLCFPKGFWYYKGTASFPSWQRGFHISCGWCSNKYSTNNTIFSTKSLSKLCIFESFFISCVNSYEGPTGTRSFRHIFTTETHCLWPIYIHFKCLIFANKWISMSVILSAMWISITYRCIAYTFMFGALLPD